MIPRYGDPRESGQRYRLRPGAYAVLWRDGRVLLTHQQDPWPEFQLPGGGIDPGESPIQALHREVYEETGWRIGAARRLGAFRRFTFMPEYDIWAEKLCHIFLARPVRRLGPPTEPGHSAQWMAPEDAADRVGNAGDAAYLRRVIRGLT
ncbi:NUDIX hydrolase [Pararhodobacter aggregans]|uniref:NUDIX hydrolase n=1 Tax=Pararhodobacter aggregans TaxID=404875 RepID=A0A2T7UTT8_9RHOB|nr:NUDIX hydrolase [Pararhodobacter aggregans]PTX02974.1 8-oxo-dGTP diphosphatase [Pararhodobacter aggregans]PVE48183.1 NUDIX hydrolase [Pararhodobacter aggregans]